MNLATILKGKIKPELNKLYTGRHVPGDWGWFCREHAFHCYFLCRMLGFDAAIKRGDFTALKRMLPGDHWEGVSSLGQGSDHSWCQVDQIVPVDLSINFEFFAEFPWVDHVFGTGQVGKYSVCYTLDEETYKVQVADRSSLPRLMYLERRCVETAEAELLRNPYTFLTEPPKDGLGALFGNDIFHKLTMHLYDVATGKAERLTTAKRNAREVFGVIRDRYVNGVAEIGRIIEVNSGKPQFDLL